MISNSVVTLFCTDEKGESFRKKGCYAAWVHHVVSIKTELGGVREADRFDIRINTGIPGGVRPGDLVCFGRAEAVTAAAKCCRISSVAENDFGSSPHWHLKAEYIYR